MSPKSSRNGSVSRPSSVHTHAPGSDGERALDELEELARMIKNIRGAIHGMACIAYLHEDTGEGRLQELKDLAEVGEQLCTEAFQRSYDLWNVFVQWRPTKKNTEDQAVPHA